MASAMGLLIWASGRSGLLGVDIHYAKDGHLRKWCVVVSLGDGQILDVEGSVLASSTIFSGGAARSRPEGRDTTQIEQRFTVDDHRRGCAASTLLRCWPTATLS
jgi:hypothetical protein